MNAKPASFKAPMIRALLDGRKTQTRRLVKPLTKRHALVNLREHAIGAEARARYSGRQNNPFSWGYLNADDGADMVLGQSVNLCPYGQTGDLLWVREAWRTYRVLDGVPPRSIEAGAAVQYEAGGTNVSDAPYTLHDMGRYRHARFMPRWVSRLTLRITDVRVQRVQQITFADIRAEGCDTKDHAGWWRATWDGINGEGSIDADPFVWALTFEVIKANVDSVLKALEPSEQDCVEAALGRTQG